MINVRPDFGDKIVTSKEEEVVYTKQEIIQILKENLKPVKDYVGDKVVGSSKYVQLAADYGYENYKLCSAADLMRLKVYSSFSYYQRNFFSENGATVAIFNEMNGKVASIVFRAISSKAFMDYSLVYCAYGLDMMDEDFRFGDPIVLTEGIFDSDVVRTIYKNTLAMLTSNITMMQAEVLRTITDNFIILFDSDEAGSNGYGAALKRLLGCKVQNISVFKGDKDVGEMEEHRKADDVFGYTERRAYYSEKLQDMTTSYKSENVFDL